MTLLPPRASLCPQILSSVAASTATTCAGVPSRGTPSCASTVLVAICHHARLYDATRSAARGENQRESVFPALSLGACFLETRYRFLHTAHVERRAPPCATETCCQRRRHPTCTHFCVPEHAQGETSASKTRGAPKTSTSSSPTRQKRHARASAVEDDVVDVVRVPTRSPRGVVEALVRVGCAATSRRDGSRRFARAESGAFSSSGDGVGATAGMWSSRIGGSSSSPRCAWRCMRRSVSPAARNATRFPGGGRVHPRSSKSNAISPRQLRSLLVLLCQVGSLGCHPRQPRAAFARVRQTRGGHAPTGAPRAARVVRARVSSTDQMSA